MSKLAFDRSVRSYDQDGRLRVEVSPITKATVNPYHGYEIPNYEGLGLIRDKVYYLFRDPLELERAVSTFKNLPLMIKHIRTSADDHKKDLVVGTTGSNTEWCDPYINVDLMVWDAVGIAGIESQEQAELSSSYYYDADMTPGEYQGMRYDGVMRNIKGNHVALVDIGRAGPDVVVHDKNPFIEGTSMSKEQKLAQAKAKAKQALQAKLASDAKPEDIDAIIAQLAQDSAEAAESEPKKPAEDEGDEDEKKNPADDEDDDSDDGKKKPADDEDDSDDDKPTKAAMDAAIKVASDRAEANATKRIEALFQAREDVKPLVGQVALDSAESVYKFALDQKGIDTKGVHPSAYRSMVQMLKNSPEPKAKTAMDAKSVSAVQAKFPTISRIKQG
ncbi:DUF2213 domain-containing protein [Acinetobacter sp. C32I]|uniref:DUF2213 domain-containing protein n=1 Tax=Acinetobacter sp. C32I TaxID=2950074 RepID=UPI00203702DA|nr:DUF2213 domain-containing protein [Acinetobacter sp. C32I]USA53861.1 DUF2213 domain-containing protein [Acinetobacter sp. C32I]